MDDLKNSSFRLAYGYWVNNLFERVSRLFKWENTGDDLDLGIDPIHIEKPLLLYGQVGICEHERRLRAFAGSYSGVSIYYDRFPDFMVRSPLYSGRKVIGKDIAIIRNNSNETNLQQLCHRYALQLAHAEVTFTILLVNARVSSVPTVNNNKEKSIIDDWRTGVYNGKIGTVMDSGFLSVKWQDINTNTSANIKDVWEVRENILTSFYHDVGVKCAPVKKGNMIAAEVNDDDAMLLLNINDMLEQRQKGCERVNKMFGTSWRVDKCEELKYDNQVTIDQHNANEVYN